MIKLPKYIEYLSIADMSDRIIKNLQKFPHDVDLIVGIPRSGMLPANMLALYMNKPFTDIDSFIEGRIYSSGERGRFIDTNTKKRVIVVDDSYLTGNALVKAKKKLEPIADKYELIFAVVFTSSRGKKAVDVWCEIVDSPRIFQWNIFHHKPIIGQSCMDIDGVLCQNPPVDDDGEKYIEYITHAIPYIIPTVEIDTLVSCRLEKYRPQTEAWLAANNVKYRNLIMLDMPSKEERIKWGKHGEYKGSIYKRSSNILFIESSLAEANEICRVSGKMVFCTENFELLYKHRNLNKKGQKIIGLIYKYLIKPFKKGKNDKQRLLLNNK